MKEITAKELELNPITAISEEWMLITAGTEANYNTMTASWGHIGSIWGRSSFGMGTAICYVRPQRYTREFIDREAYYTLTFFPPEYKEKLAVASQTGERMVKEAVARGQAREEEIIRAANAEAAAIMDKAAADIAMEKKKALNDAKDEISGMAIAIAEKVVGRELSGTDHKKLIDDFIDELGEQV